MKCDDLGFVELSSSSSSSSEINSSRAFGLTFAPSVVYVAGRRGELVAAEWDSGGEVDGFATSEVADARPGEEVGGAEKEGENGSKSAMRARVSSVDALKRAPPALGDCVAGFLSLPGADEPDPVDIQSRQK